MQTLQLGPFLLHVCCDYPICFVWSILNMRPVPTIAVTFNPQDQYARSLPGTQNSVWDKLIPRKPKIYTHLCSSWRLNALLILAGRGFITVKDPTSWGLSGGIPVPDELSPRSESYCISAFHQLHCLVSTLSLNCVGLEM